MACITVNPFAVLSDDVIIQLSKQLGAQDANQVKAASQIISEVLDRSEEAIHKENKVRDAILNGVDPQQAYLKYGKF